MICKQCGSRLRENNQCSKCGYDNHYYMEKLPKHLEQLDEFMLEDAKKPVNQQAVVMEQYTGNRQNSVNADNRQNKGNPKNSAYLRKSDNLQNPANQQAVATERYTGNRQNSVNEDSPQNIYDSQNTANQQNATSRIQQRNLQTSATPQRSGKGSFMVFGIIGIVCIAIIAVTFGFFVGRNHKDSTVIVEQTQDTEMMSAETETAKTVESETQKIQESESRNILESDVNESVESETSQQGNSGDAYAESNGTGTEPNNRNGRNLPGSSTGGSVISEQYNTETETDPTAETGRLRY